MEGFVSNHGPAAAAIDPAASHYPRPALSSLSASELERQLTELTGHLNAATHRWLVLLAEFDTRNAWNGVGVQSCAHWPRILRLTYTRSRRGSFRSGRGAVDRRVLDVHKGGRNDAVGETSPSRQ